MTSTTTEQAFEEAIEKSLIEKGGYTKNDPSDFDRELAFDPKTIFAFLKDTQPQSWEKLSEIHGSQTESKILQRLFKELTTGAHSMCSATALWIMASGLRWPISNRPAG